MPSENTNALITFIDWFGKISLIKKVYATITILVFINATLIKYYYARISNIDDANNIRIDSITYFYTRQLEKCNSENKKEYKNMLRVLQESLEQQNTLKLETEKLAIETEKIKHKFN